MEKSLLNTPLLCSGDESMPYRKVVIRGIWNNPLIRLFRQEPSLLPNAPRLCRVGRLLENPDKCKYIFIKSEDVKKLEAENKYLKDEVDTLEVTIKINRECTVSELKELEAENKTLKAQLTASDSAHREAIRRETVLEETDLNFAEECVESTTCRECPNKCINALRDTAYSMKKIFIELAEKEMKERK